MSSDEYAKDEVISELHEEAVMKRATLEQCIYLFVEGESEEEALPVLLDRCGIDLENIGIIIANYKGSGNLELSLRLLNQTLSHDRPIIVTFDNDEKGKKVPSSIAKLEFKHNLISMMPIPDKPVVIYGCGHKGGSYEESFEPKHFIKTCFKDGIVERSLLSKKSDFEANFKPDKPWYRQFKDYCYMKDGQKFIPNKIKLAIALAENCKTVPDTFVKLAGLLLEVRSQHPIRHLDDVDLPKIHGLTC